MARGWRGVCGTLASVMMMGGVSAAALGRPTIVGSSASHGVVDRLLEQSDGIAPVNETPEASRARRLLLLEMLTRTPLCYVANPTDEQLRLIIDRYQGRPVAEMLPMEGPVDRFFISGSWTGNGLQGGGGAAARATLMFSFPADGISWRDSENALGDSFALQFGASNTDRGRELVRQALASWRRMAGLTYNEVIDTNAGFSNSTSPVGGGDIRIGASFQGNTGVLAYNFYPGGGGDMAINASELVASSLLSANNNYRYFRNVVAHEHGHGLGFAHPVPCNRTKLMEPFATTTFDMTQVDEMRAAQRNYGDRFAGNSSADAAQDFGNLTTPALRSIIERGLSTNGAAGPNGTNHDWFRFALSSAQNVTISVVPTGGSYANAQQTSGCNPTTQPTVNAVQAGNLNVELRDAAGNTVLEQANTAAAGGTETITAAGLAAGTYTVRVVDVGPNAPADQFVQLYDLTIRVGTSKAPPQAIAGVNKRIAAGRLCYFMGDANSRVNETGAAFNTASYDWDLDGDGSFETLDQPQPTRVYNANGIVPVTLRVTDSNGMSATDTITVAVGGAIPSIFGLAPPQGALGSTVPITISGASLAGVATSSQVAVSGTGVWVVGVPVVTDDGATVSGLSLAVAVNAAAGPRAITITNADGTGQSAILAGAFSVTSTPPANDTCAAPISWGQLPGARPFSTVAATTGAPQSFPGTSCPAAGPIENDVWYSWTAPANGNLNVNTDSETAGSPAPFYSRVAMYSGAACPPVTLLGCDDFGVSFNAFVQGGRTYLFQVGSINPVITGTANVILTFTPVVGACCDSSGGCTITASNECVGTSQYQGNGTSCEVPGCEPPLGTCCTTAGSCRLTERGACADLFIPGGSCDPNPCPQPSGSCCSADGSCIMSEEADCDAGRAWTVGGICDPNPCPQPTGACCDGTACSIAAADACTGAFKGVGSVCGDPGNPVACCPANFNQQGGVTVQDIFDFLAAYFGGQPSADFNSSGGITVQDIFDFLAAYFTSCA